MIRFQHLLLSTALLACLAVGCTPSGSGSSKENNGSSQGKKGGTMLTSIPNWPENLRVYGTGANTYLNAIIQSLCYETLCTIDENTLEFQPGLAKEWTISDDKMKFTFKMDERAVWSDGKPVTAKDVVATYKLLTDDTLIDPMSKATIVDKMEEPKAISDHELEIVCKSKDWRNFITISGMTILPAHEIETLTGKQYLDNYNFKLTATSGPYSLPEEGIDDGDSITLSRRTDYWAINEPRNKDHYNFDKIRFKVIRESRLAFDKACKGELDFYPVYTAKWWVEDLPNLETIEKGHMIRQKVFTRFPQGIQGLAFNMRKAPFDDVRVRKAIAHLYDRRKMLEKFAYNEYDPLKSYYPGGDSENPENEIVEYDPVKAAELLEEAGWSDRGDDGILIKDGKRLSFTISYRTPGLEKYFTTLKQDCRKAGVEINLSLLTPETQWKNAQERNFQVLSMAWGAVLFPSPRGTYHSEMADKDGSNNITGFKSEAADKIIDEYDAEFDMKKRVELLKQLDKEIFDSHSYALAWYLPCERILYKNKFGMPETVLPKYGDWRSAFATWWADPEKEAALKKARKTGGTLSSIPPVEIHPWDEDDEKTVTEESASDEPETEESAADKSETEK